MLTGVSGCICPRSISKFSKYLNLLFFHHFHRIIRSFDAATMLKGVIVNFWIESPLLCFFNSIRKISRQMKVIAIIVIVVSIVIFCSMRMILSAGGIGVETHSVALPLVVLSQQPSIRGDGAMAPLFDIFRPAKLTVNVV